jgi:hypothetical protein
MAGPTPGGAIMTISEFSMLPLLERIQKFRDIADSARAQAESASSQVARMSYVLIAQHWEALATDAEQKLESGKRWLRE